MKGIKKERRDRKRDQAEIMDEGREKEREREHGAGIMDKKEGREGRG